jgi:hypothetical protein
MKKIILSAVTALTLGSVAANASDIKLYQDANGQVFTSAAEGRTLIEDKSTSVFAKADKLKFSGLTYIGYTYDDYKSGMTSNGTTAYSSDTQQFEIRRAYFQLKAYLLDDPKSYYRVTFDMSKDIVGDEKVRAKYAYLYLDSILPATGVEIGLAHRPWHDYEEHNSWYFRNISTVLIESKNGADLSNSADFGIMTKTATKYFDADIGLFNGEGYHSYQTTPSMSLEWRATAHILGVSGKDKQGSTTYWDASFFGQYNQEHKALTNDIAPKDRGYEDLIFAGLHTVYNMPSFLVAAQYVQSQDTRANSIVTGSASSGYKTSDVSGQAGSGYSVNGEYRLGANKDYRILARYDSWTPKVMDTDAAYNKANRTGIAGFAWDQNRNVEWVANVEITKNQAGSSREKFNGTAYMLTAQVEF